MDDDVRGTARTALEAARREVVRRLDDLGLPTSVETKRLLVVDNEDLTGWRSSWEDVRQSSVHVPAIERAIADDSIDFRMLGLRAQLEPLARALARLTPLGTRVPAGLPAQDDPAENALIAYAQPMAFAYLSVLEDLAEESPRYLNRFLEELSVLVDRGEVWERGQLALDGIAASSPLTAHRGVSLRALSPAERGRWVQSRTPSGLPLVHGDFVVVHRWEHFTPRALLDWVEEPDASGVDSRLAYRLALAFFLRGHRIAVSNEYPSFCDPSWASFGFATGRLPVEASSVGPPKAIDDTEFREVVDLAFSMPPFGPEEATREQVVLHRVLKGCGAQESALLDLAIALEAALLKGTSDELAYRFRLYGALFLAPDRDPLVTGEQLKQVYRVRSRLVHGAPVPAKQLRDATETARTIATAIARRSVETGWPDPDALDRAAIGRSLSDR